jgi:hypothetical protein
MDELLRLAWLRKYRYTEQLEKFVGDPQYREVPYKEMERRWNDMGAAIELIKEQYGREAGVVLNDYAIKESRGKVN